MGHIAKTHPDDVHMLVEMRESDMLDELLEDIEAINRKSEGDYDDMLNILSIKIACIFEYIRQMRS